MDKEQSIVVYGKGDFFYLHSESVKRDYCICGFVDKGLSDSSEIKNEWKTIEDIDVDYNKVLIMSENPDSMFEMLLIVKNAGISFDRIVMGIAYYGYLSEYYKFDITKNYAININSECGNIVTSNPMEYKDALRYLMERIVKNRGRVLKKALQKLYEDKSKILWIDKYQKCSDHDIDVYVRYEREGYFGWGHVATIIMLALNQFDSPYILDLGCGSGYYYRHLCKYVSGLNYVGCDNDFASYLAIYEDEFNKGNTDFVVADFAKNMPNPLKKKNFDVITWNGSYSCFDDDEHKKIIESASKKLGQNGIFVVSDYFSEKNNSPWYYSINSARDKGKLRKKFQEVFDNVFLYIDKKEGGFYLLASNGKLPVNN